MEFINAALKQAFEKQYPGTQVTIANSGTEAALQALKAGKIQLAAIGRPLTAGEKAEGLVAVPIARHKIALIVGPNSPFKGTLTIDQFAKIFRGEITDWSQVGGAAAPIRLVDRPEMSDIRQAFQQYPIFQKAPFQSGSTALRVDQDRTSGVIEQLGSDGLGYAIADQVLGNPAVRTVSLHNTQPDNSKYPFSQPLSYVYKGAQPSQVVKDFLGYVTTPDNQAVIEAARIEAAKQSEKATAAIAGTTATAQNSNTPTTTASPDAYESATGSAAGSAPETTAESAPGAASTPAETASNAQDGIVQTENSPSGNPQTGNSMAQTSDSQAVSPWWWLLLPILGIPILWAVWPKASRSPIEDGGPLVGDAHSGAIATPDMPASDISAPDMPTSNISAPDISAPDMPTPDIPTPNVGGDWNTGLGAGAAAGLAASGAAAYVASQTGVSQTEASQTEATVATDSEVAQTPDSEAGSEANLETGALPGVMAGALGAGGLGMGAAAAMAPGKSEIGVDATPGIPSYETEYGSRIILVPRNANDAYAYWEVSDAHKAAVRQQGGKDLKLRLCDVTDGNWDVPTPHNIYEFDCSEQDRDRHLPIRNSDHEYLVDLGYLTEDGQWLSLTRSRAVQITSEKNHASL
jgi:ABC-type phosphate transport system substrate-binding protein